MSEARQTELMEKAIKSDGSVDVNVQDQSSDIVDYFICKNLFDLELAVDAVIDEYTVVLVNGSQVVNGTYICIQEGTRAFQSKVLSGGGTNTVTLDTPIDYGFTTSATIRNRTPEMNVNGSVTPQIYSIKPLPGVVWDVTRILASIITLFADGAPNDTKFGGRPALTKGIVIRKSNGVHHTIFNAKNNGDLRLRMFDVTFSETSPSASYGVSFRRTFAGQDKNGVVIRLDGDLNEALEIVIQDDLSGYSSFRAVAQGHLVI